MDRSLISRRMKAAHRPWLALAGSPGGTPVVIRPIGGSNHRKARPVAEAGRACAVVSGEGVLAARPRAVSAANIADFHFVARLLLTLVTPFRSLLLPPSTNPRSLPMNRAFTLIELLVVITII